MADGRADPSGDMSGEFGSGGRKIAITPPEPGVVDGVSSTVAAGTFRVAADADINETRD